MSVQYPSAIYSPTAKVHGSIVTATDWNDVAGEEVAVQTELGTLPKGDHATVKDRLNAIDLRAIQNALINGGMEIWQRNTTFSSPATGAYTVDRWKANTNGAPTFTVSREGTIIDSGLYAAKVDITVVGGSGLLQLQQFIENFKDFAGKTISVYARIRSNVAASIRMQCYDGVSNTFSGYHSGGGAYETITLTKAMSAGTSQFFLAIGFDGTVSVSTFYIDSVFIVVGSQPLAFVPADPTVEMARCQRYYQKSYNESIFPGAVSNPGAVVGTYIINAYSQPIPFRVQMRTTPTFVAYSPVTGTSVKARNDSAAADFTVSQDFVGQTGGHLLSGGDPASTGQQCSVHWTADAEI